MAPKWYQSSTKVASKWHYARKNERSTYLALLFRFCSRLLCVLTTNNFKEEISTIVQVRLCLTSFFYLAGIILLVAN